MTNKYAVKIIGGMGTIGAICYKGFDFNGTWFDSKEDAEEFKRMLEYSNKYTTYEIIEEGENMSNLEPVEQDSEHRHPHADMIIEWAKDTSKVVEFWDNGAGCWFECDDNNPHWHTEIRHRFQPAKPERVFPTTSLSDIELTQTYSPLDVGSCKAYRAIADAAIKQYILDTEKADDK